MADPLRVRLSGPLEPFAGGFAADLARQGYARDSVVLQLQLMAHLSRWLESERLAVGELRGAVVVERFVAARRARYTRHVSPRALAPLLGYLRGTGVVAARAAAVPPSPAEAVLERHRCYLVSERGLRAETARGYVGRVRPFVVEHVTADGSPLADLTAADASAFVLAACRGRSAGSAKLTVTALRSLLRFLHVEGLIDGSLSAAVPAVAGWRLAGLPRALEAGATRALMAGCDRGTVVGRRDFAVLTLLRRLALRAGELVRLRLDDIDWHAGELVIRGKGDRYERLPLPADVGEALADYLRRGRPAGGESRAVFMRVRAPHGPLTVGAVKQIVARAGLRAGVGDVTPHRLRHTAATEMLRAGAPLSEIAQVLRHRYLSSTAIYAKVDREALRSLARPWPAGAGVA
jgi:site-specific recombinase XerD